MFSSSKCCTKLTGIIQPVGCHIINPMMYLNCRRIIVTSIKVSEHLFADYLDEFRTLLEDKIPNFAAAETLRVVP